jgi:hypothetical protein
MSMRVIPNLAQETFTGPRVVPGIGERDARWASGQALFMKVVFPELTGPMSKILDPWGKRGLRLETTLLTLEWSRAFIVRKLPVPIPRMSARRRVPPPERNHLDSISYLLMTVRIGLPHSLRR